MELRIASTSTAGRQISYESMTNSEFLRQTVAATLAWSVSTGACYMYSHHQSITLCVGDPHAQWYLLPAYALVVVHRVLLEQ